MTDTNQLAEALAQLQADLPKIGKTERANVRSEKGNYSYTYADLASVSAQIMPRLGKLGLSFTAWPTMTGDGRFVLAYRLWHVSDQRIEGEYPLSGNTPQAVGSAITYARRYVLCAITGVSPEDDDDGAAAQAHTVQAPPPQRQKADRPSAYQRGSSSDRPAGDNGKITKAQLSKLHACLTDYGLGDNRDAALAFYADTIGHDVESSKDLTKAEASQVIERLVTELGKGTDVPADEPDPTLDEDYQP